MCVPSAADMLIFSLPSIVSLQLASVVYERDPDVIHQTLKETFNSPPTMKQARSATASAAHHVKSDSSGSPSGIPVSKPGRLLHDLYQSADAKRIEATFMKSHDNKGEDAIAFLCGRFGIQYEHVSELNNSSSVSSRFGLRIQS